MSVLDRLFRLREAGTTVRREASAGLVTFAALSYILFLQPALLSTPGAGMDAEGVFFATCVASAVACFLMAWWANYPIALAPAMGHNIFFVFTVCIGLGLPWQEALAANLLAGLAFLLLAPTGLRERVMEAVPDCLKFAIAAGIGMMIALVGLEFGEIVVADPVTYLKLGDLKSPVAVLTLFGLALMAVLMVRKVPGAILLGLLGTAAAGALATRLLDPGVELVRWRGLVGAPPSPAATAFQLDFAGLFSRPLGTWLAVLSIFLILDLFDTVGTLMGVGERAGFLKDGKLPRARGALAADAAGTVTGALLGTSTVTSYVESAAGIAAGGRTGLTAVVCGLCLLAALVLSPMVEMIGAGVNVAPEGAAAVLRYPVIAPVLMVIGAMMLATVRRVDWEDHLEAIPAFLTIIVMQVSFSVTDGIAFGFISYSLLSLASGRYRGTSPLVHFFAVVFAARYAFLDI